MAITVGLWGKPGDALLPKTAFTGDPCDKGEVAKQTSMGCTALPFKKSPTAKNQPMAVNIFTRGP